MVTLPLLGAIAGGRRRGGCTRWHVVPLLGAGCHCWGWGGGGCTSWRIGCGDVAGRRCWVPLLGYHCWVPLLGAIGGCVHVGGLDVVPLLAAISGCHCWAAIAGLPLLGAIAGRHCRCWLPLLGGMWSGAMVGAVRFHCWVPLLDAIGGDRLDVVPLLGAMVRCDGKMPWWVSLFGALAACWPLLGAVW